MVMTLDRALSIVEHASYGGATMAPLDVVNEAGDRLMGMHPWAWSVVPPRQLSARAPVTITDGIWDSGSAVLRGIADQLSGYTFANGDTFTITASNTGAALRDVTITESSLLTSGYLRFTELLNSIDDTITGTINANRAVIMPTDFGYGLTAYVTTAGLTSYLTLVSQADLAFARTASPAPAQGAYIGSLFTAPDLTTAGGAPTYRLELYPYPSAGQTALVTVSYRRRWVPTTTDSKIISIPSFVEPLYVALLRAVAMGYEDEEAGTVEDRIDRIRGSSLFMDLTNADGLMQPDFGPMRGGNETVASAHWHTFPSIQASDPS